MKSKDKMPDIKKLRLFDACVTMGRVILKKAVNDFTTAEPLVDMMNRYQISDALVHDYSARLLCPREHGNKRLLDMVRDAPRLHPVWVIDPPSEPGVDASAKLVEDMLGHGVKAARFPMSKVPPFAWLWRDLCSELEKHRVPCFLDFGHMNTRGDLTDADVAGIRDIALAHPELPLVISHIMGGRGLHPAMVPLIKRVPNLHLDITGILEYWRQVAVEVGPERVLFATGAPFTDPGILISNVQYALELDENMKEMICGDNLRRLMGEVR